ncbi:MAG: hypothetical protein CMJ48_06880 [Planctomycetaceae bacterium]|nr:hypothetical protein [Planctomycetaceae bacterium]
MALMMQLAERLIAGSGYSSAAVRGRFDLRMACVCFCVLLGHLLAADAGAAARWKAGVAKEKITPEIPMWMAGYAGRPSPAREKIHDLWVKALAMQDSGGRRAVLVTMDVTGIDRRFSLAVCEELKEKYRLERRQIALCSSHTHSGPVTSDRFTFVFGLDEGFHQRRLEFLESLHAKIVSVVGQALERLAPCELASGRGSATFAYNRRNNGEADVVRLREEGNLRGPVDFDVPVLSVRTEDETLLAVVFGYACHGTTLGPSNLKWSGDYAGHAQLNLEEAYPGCTALYWAGCGGDQNPGPRREQKHVESHGRELSETVQATLKKTLRPIVGPLATSYEEIELPFAELPTRKRLEEEAASGEGGMARRARFILHQIERGYPLEPTYPYPVQVWRLGYELLFVTLGGEAVVDYALRLKQELGEERTWVASYANDAMAYIASGRVLREGGYEGLTSIMVYGLPAAWGPQIEPLIVDSVHRQVKTLGAAPRAPSGRVIAFEGTAGVLDPQRWYVSGGMNTTHLRGAGRQGGGSWALSTTGEGSDPDFLPNVQGSAIDANTSVAWGPFFTLKDELPPGAQITLQISGGSKPWSDSLSNGPTGLAFWDLAANAFARDRAGEVIYVACRTNGFDFERRTIDLAGLGGKRLGLVVVDRAAQSWAWTSVDDITLPREGFTYSDKRHHQVTVVNDFDDAKSLDEWTGDAASFQLGGPGNRTPLSVNQNVGALAPGFPEDTGYLSSRSRKQGDAARGTLESPTFPLEGDILEFFLAGTGRGGAAFELVAEDGKVLATTHPAVARFTYHFWRIKKPWRGTTARVRLVDNSTTGHIEVDAVRLVQFDVEDEANAGSASGNATKQEATVSVHAAVSSNQKAARRSAPKKAAQAPPKRKAPARALQRPSDDRPAVALVSRVVDNQSDGKTVLHPMITYAFSTQHLSGEIRPNLPKPGVVRCRHKPTNFEVLPEIPQHALLMPEWLLKPGNGRKGLFWAPLRAVPRVSVEGGSVLFHVGADQTQDWNMDITFRYTPERDWIDFECTIIPHAAIKDFELFIASYITEAMESTWVSAATDDGEQFRKVDCRNTIPWGSVYTIARDAKAKTNLQDGRWQLPPKEAGEDLWQEYYFKRPILTAMQESTGLAAVTMVDPAVCSLLAGQHHVTETAHDFSLAGDLVPKQPFVGRARIVIRKIGRFPEAKKQIDAMWAAFEKSLRAPAPTAR